MCNTRLRLFPIEAIDELYKQMIPDINAQLPTPNPTWTNRDDAFTGHGIYGNSHMLMQDRNSDQLADLILAWIDEHVE